VNANGVPATTEPSRLFLIRTSRPAATSARSASAAVDEFSAAPISSTAPGRGGERPEQPADAHGALDMDTAIVWNNGGEAELRESTGQRRPVSPSSATCRRDSRAHETAWTAAPPRGLLPDFGLASGRRVQDPRGQRIGVRTTRQRSPVISSALRHRVRAWLTDCAPCRDG
jgi:hypothetical protein